MEELMAMLWSLVILQLFALAAALYYLRLFSWQLKFLVTILLELRQQQVRRD